MKSRCDIDGTTVSSVMVSWEYPRFTQNQVSEIKMIFSLDVNNSVTLEVGQQLEVWRGWTNDDDEKIFNGYINKFEIQGNIVKITAKDKLWDLVRLSVNKVYDKDVDASAGKISDIFIDLVTTYGLLTADGTTVQDSGTVLILNKFFCRQTDIFERIQALADMLNWQFYYKASDDKVYFEPKGYTNSSVTLKINPADTTNNILQLPKWNKNTSKMINKLTIFGASVLVDDQYTDVGDGGTTVYTLSNIPVNMVNVTVNGVKQVGGIEDVTTTPDYVIDSEKKQITFTVAPPIAHAIVVDYQYNVPTPVVRRVQSSIDSYGTHQSQMTLTDVQDVIDAERRGQEILSHFSEPFYSSKLKQRVPTAADVVNAGETVAVLDNANTPNINQNFIVNKVIVRFPNRFDEIHVGESEVSVDEVVYGLANKIKRLEELNTKDQDILTHVEDIVADVRYRNRYFKFTEQNISGNSGIYDHPLFGLYDTAFYDSGAGMIWGHSDPNFSDWGTAKWGNVLISFILGHTGAGILGTSTLGSTVSQEVISRMIQENLIYTELFYDTDFSDTSETTATWSTANGQIEYTGAQSAQSEFIAYNGETVNISRAKLTATSDNNLLTYYMSVDDGSTWEEVTNGVWHTFATTGQKLKWKITSSNTDNLTALKIEYEET